MKATIEIVQLEGDELQVSVKYEPRIEDLDVDSPLPNSHVLALKLLELIRGNTTGEKKKKSKYL